MQNCQGRSPYSLYALSNLGSLLALLSYPFVFEPNLKLAEQTQFWSLGFGLFVFVCGVLAFEMRNRYLLGGLFVANKVDDRECLLSDSLSIGLRWFYWISFPAVTSALLLAVTNQLCQDVASVPFLWIMPLSLYLFSFIICFGKHNWYSRRLFIPALLLGAAGMLILLYLRSKVFLEWQLLIYSLGLFSVVLLVIVNCINYVHNLN